MITAALSRTIIIGYTEKHHIIPKSIGGTDTPDNLVTLTAREHFIAHRLLAKITEGDAKGKMLHAVWMMAIAKGKGQYRITITGRTYEAIRIARIEEGVSDETRQRISISLSGRTLSEEHKTKIGAANTCPSDETRSKMSAAQSGEKNHGYGKTLSDEHKEKVGASLRGIPKSVEHSAKIAEAARLSGLAKRGQKMNTRKATCIHCGKFGGQSAITRYHNDNCKKKVK